MLKETLDIEFSKFIRLRDCQTNGRCISCGVSITYETSDAGHYIPRKHMSTRFDEKNVNAQCRLCNRGRDGNETGYEKGLIYKYGGNVLEELKGQRNRPLKLSQSEMRDLIKYYKEQQKILKKKYDGGYKI